MNLNIQIKKLVSSFWSLKRRLSSTRVLNSFRRFLDSFLLREKHIEANIFVKHNHNEDTNHYSESNNFHSINIIFHLKKGKRWRWWEVPNTHTLFLSMPSASGDRKQLTMALPLPRKSPNFYRTNMYLPKGNQGLIRSLWPTKTLMSPKNKLRNRKPYRKVKCSLAKTQKKSESCLILKRFLRVQRKH